MIIIRNGKYKNKRIDDSKLDSNITRPSKDIVKNSVFNIIRSYAFTNSKDIKNMVFLDLFSGTGSVGIEALSLEFEKVIFNDKNKTVINFIDNTLKNVIKDKEIEDKYHLINDDYLEVPNIIKNKNIVDSIDVIFLDPPYELTLDFNSLINNLKTNNLVNSKTIFIYEIDKKVEDIPHLEELNLVKEYKYGKTYLYLFFLKDK